MFSFLSLTSLELTCLGLFAAFVAGVVLSQKVKDWFSGVPSDVRSALKTVEASALGNLKVARSAVLDQLVTALPPVAATPIPLPVEPPAPPAPPAPVAVGTVAAGS